MKVVSVSYSISETLTRTVCALVKPVLDIKIKQYSMSLLYESCKILFGSKITLPCSGDVSIELFSFSRKW